VVGHLRDQTGGPPRARCLDVHHHRTNRVVVRSLAEFCLVLDTALAVAIVIVTVPK